MSNSQKSERTCELCMTPVQILGNTTLYYHSEYFDLLAQAEALAAALDAVSKRHDWMPGMGECICKQHQNARSAFAEFQNWKKTNIKKEQKP